MTKLYPIQVIALDKISHQALDLAELKKFDDMIKIEPEQLASVTITDYHQIVVLSELNENIMDKIVEELSQLVEPIVIFPTTAKESDHVKQLLLMGVRVVYSYADSLVAVSLSQTLKILESVFYGNGSEMEIEVDHEDIYEVMGRGTLTEFYEDSRSQVSVATMNALNIPEGFSNVSGTYILYDIHEDLPMMQIAEAMKIVENKMPEDSGIIFGTRNTHTNMKYIKVTCMISRYVDFKHIIQQNINDSETYMEKLAVIVDAFAEGSVTGEEADLLADRNNLARKDLSTVYAVAYTQPIETVKLMQMLRDDNFTRERKEEAIADVLIDTNIDSDILSEIAMTKELSIDNIFAISTLKKEGKLPLQDVEISNGLRDKYPNLTLVKSADTLVLLNKDDPLKESSGIMTIETNELTLYEKNGVEWFVGKNLGQDKVDNFIGEYLA